MLTGSPYVLCRSSGLYMPIGLVLTATLRLSERCNTVHKTFLFWRRSEAIQEEGIDDRRSV